MGQEALMATNGGAGWGGGAAIGGMRSPERGHLGNHRAEHERPGTRVEELKHKRTSRGQAVEC